MIATGSGIAPFISFLQEKSFRLEKQPKEFTYGEWNLFFGCCKKNSDYLYRDEISSWAEENIIQNLHLAFSRDQAQKIYVTHLLKAKPEIAKMLFKGGKVYICGSLRMGKDVESVLDEHILSYIQENDLGTDLAAAKKMFNEEDQIIRELWD